MAGRRNTFAFWIAVALATACLALVVIAHGTTSQSALEPGGFSFAWVAGGAALLAILIHELLDSTTETPRKKAPRPEKPGNRVTDSNGVTQRN